MPHASLKLTGGVNSNETEALNENGGISFSNLVRFFYDPNGLSLLQKLGGWLKFFSSPMIAVVRALWAWEDLNVESHLTVATETGVAYGYAQLLDIVNGVPQVITPRYIIETVASGSLSPTIGSPYITITDANTNLVIYQGDSVYIATQISVGGVVLFGSYPCNPNQVGGSNVYTIMATDQLGNPLNATSTAAQSVPVFITTFGSPTVTVILGAFTYAIGDTFPVLVPSTVGGITFYGNYIVQGIIDASHFTIRTQNSATSSASGGVNFGAASYIYNIGDVPSAETPYDSEGIAISAEDWTLDNWGGSVLACPIQPLPSQVPYQPIYVWVPGSSLATVITQAPPVNDGIFVAMPQRQIVAWGSTQTGIQDPLLVSWCDVGNYNQWIPLVTNQAGSFRIPKGSRIVGAVQGPQQGIIWTDIDAWSMQYIGPPYVYSFNEIGSGCGLIARKAAAFINGVGYWMGPSQFFTLSSAGVQPLPCSVWDIVFQNLNPSYLTNIRIAVNSRFNEIQWFYPSTSSTSGENDSYVKYNITLGVWDYGSLGRSAWIDQSILGPPIGADPNSLYLYQHETSNDADGTAMNSYLQTGYYAIGEADVKSFVDWVWPDAKWGQLSQAQTANLQITFFVADYPGQTPTQYGPYTVTQATQYFFTRFRGRLVSVRVGSSDLGSWWRIGNIRYRYAIDGKI